MIVVLMVLICVPTISFSQNFADYLILQDIGPYKLEAPQKVVGGFIGGPRVFDGAGVIAPTGHFYLDHTDETYEVYYEGGSTLPSATVQVTQHFGGDSDKWLLHEVDKEFRTYYGVPDPSYIVKTVDGNTILTFGAGGWDYRWISGNKVIMIEYHDSQMTKPEPLEIVKAYLAKHPPTLPTITTESSRNSVNVTAWIKDEMDRRLWLCDKWFEQLQLGKTDQKTALQEAVKSMNVFLDYREKYYGMKAADEKNLLDDYLSKNNETSIKSKLQEYKTWWTANKTGSLIGLSMGVKSIYHHVVNFFKKLFTFVTSLLQRLLAVFS
jgi:hypothetical protein